MFVIWAVALTATLVFNYCAAEVSQPRTVKENA